MSLLALSFRRPVAEIGVAAVLLLAGPVLAALGIAHWLLTLLPAAYPCGETYAVHAACRLADPEALAAGHRLMIGVPVACSLLGTGVAVWTYRRWRRAVLPAAAAAAIALAAFLIGQWSADTALAHTVPW